MPQLPASDDGSGENVVLISGGPVLLPLHDPKSYI